MMRLHGQAAGPMTRPPIGDLQRHDLNNTLAKIMGFAELGQDQTRDPWARAELAGIIATVERLAERLSASASEPRGGQPPAKVEAAQVLPMTRGHYVDIRHSVS